MASKNNMLQPQLSFIGKNYNQWSIQIRCCINLKNFETSLKVELSNRLMWENSPHNNFENWKRITRRIRRHYFSSTKQWMRSYSRKISTVTTTKEA